MTCLKPPPSTPPTTTTTNSHLSFRPETPNCAKMFSYLAQVIWPAGQPSSDPPPSSVPLAPLVNKPPGLPDLVFSSPTSVSLAHTSAARVRQESDAVDALDTPADIQGPFAGAVDAQHCVLSSEILLPSTEQVRELSMGRASTFAGTSRMPARVSRIELGPRASSD